MPADCAALSFHIRARSTDSAAHTGELLLNHGSVETPAFMPVGTQGSVKAISQQDLEQLDYKLILSNAYHLHLRPGEKIIEQSGGLHQFISWPHNILTDSGGYQVFSLAALRTLDEEGVSFRSHIDGSPRRLTPDKVIALQAQLGSDIIMPLDVCTSSDAGEREAAEALRITTNWARQSARYWRNQGCPGALFGIVQGNFYPTLRRQSAAELLELDLPGYALGGLSVGETTDQFRETLESSASLLPEERPRYVMGIGDPQRILIAVSNGIDLFDSVFPTRIARNGTAMTHDGFTILRNARYRDDDNSLEEDCNCSVCRRYSRKYLHHLIHSKEILAPMLITYHNLHFMAQFMRLLRQAIRQDRLQQFTLEFLTRYTGASIR